MFLDSEGMATTLRQKVEMDRLAALTVPIVEDVHINDDLGGGIVVKDNNPLESRRTLKY